MPPISCRRPSALPERPRPPLRTASFSARSRAEAALGCSSARTALPPPCRHRAGTVSLAFWASADVLLDPRDAAKDKTRYLTSLAFDQMHPELGGMGMGMGIRGMGGGNAALPDGAEVRILRRAVQDRVRYERTVPSHAGATGPGRSRLPPADAFNGQDAVPHRRAAVHHEAGRSPHQPGRHGTLGVHQPGRQHAPPNPLARLSGTRDGAER